MAARILFAVAVILAAVAVRGLIVDQRPTPCVIGTATACIGVGLTDRP